MGGPGTVTLYRPREVLTDAPLSASRMARVRQELPRPVLDRKTEPLKEAEADRGAGEDEEGEVDVVAALVADHRPAQARDPGQGTLDHPAILAEALAALDAAPGDARDDAAPAAGTAAAGVVV